MLITESSGGDGLHLRGHEERANKIACRPPADMHVVPKRELRLNLVDFRY